MPEQDGDKAISITGQYDNFRNSANMKTNFGKDIKEPHGFAYFKARLKGLHEL